MEPINSFSEEKNWGKTPHVWVLPEPNSCSSQPITPTTKPQTTKLTTTKQQPNLFREEMMRHKERNVMWFCIRLGVSRKLINLQHSAQGSCHLCRFGVWVSLSDDRERRCVVWVVAGNEVWQCQKKKESPNCCGRSITGGRERRTKKKIREG